MKPIIGNKRGNQWLSVLIIMMVLTVMNVTSASEKVFASESPKGKCEMTIYSNKHDWNNHAQASGPCAGLVTGYYNGTFHIYGMTTDEVTHNGQVFDVGTPAYKYPTSDLTVHIVVVKESKPEEKKPDPKPIEKKPDPNPVEKKPGPKPEEKKPVPKPVEKQPVSKPVEKNPVPKPKQKQPEQKTSTVNKPEKKENSTVAAKKEQTRTDEVLTKNVETRVLELLKEWIANKDNSLIEETAEKIIQLGLDNIEIPVEMGEEIVKVDGKLTELIQFFSQPEVLELEGLNVVADQLSNFEKLHFEKQKVEEVELDVEENLKSDQKAMQVPEQEKKGFFKSVGSTISTFFKSIGTFFTNLF